jgi:midasin (ATPase involved in ribosome maturation)
MDKTELAVLYQRWKGGENIAALARQQGVAWQKLHADLTRFGSERSEDAMIAQKEAPQAQERDYDELFSRLAEALGGHLRPNLDEAAVRRMIEDQIGQARLPRPLEIRLPDGVAVKIEGRTHHRFEQVLGLVQEGHKNMLMVGPAGSGKTTLAKQLAHALNVDFGFISLSAGVTETHLFGRVLPDASGNWEYRPSRFVEVYENGGVFLLDEIDAADSNVMVAINAALANGVLANPVNGKLHFRHEKCYIIGAANTWLTGGDVQYVGRNQLDAATVDRFVLATVFVDYDADLEMDLVIGMLDDDRATALLGWVSDLREKIRQNRLRRVASTRLVVHGAMALRQGTTLDDVKSRYFMSWSPDERAKVGA